MVGFNVRRGKNLRDRRRPGARGILTVLALGSAMGAAAPWAIAQSSPTKPATYNPGAVEFEAAPIKVESMGLTMLIPIGATSQAKSVGTLATVRILPAPGPGQQAGEATWMMDIQTIGELPAERADPKNPRPVEALTNTVMADRSIKEILKTYGKIDQTDSVLESEAKLLLREQNLKIKRAGGDQTLSAERFYISFPQGTNRVVRGSTICQLNPGRFATFTLFVKEQDFERTRPVYEAMVASATLADPADAGLARAALLEAGKAVLAGLNEADYRAVIEARGERWDRLYKVAPGGGDAMATERGYRRTKAWLGHKGEMNPDRDPADWKKGEQTEGYLVSVEYRLLADPEHRPSDDKWSMSDATALYFMSLDGKEEMWVIRQTDRGPNSRPGTNKETGARFDDNKMQVTIEGPGVAPTIIKPLFNPDGYISQVQTFLLPQLLVRGGVPADFGFYCYQSRSQKVQLRTDSLRRPSDRPGVWELRFKLTEDSPELLMLLNDKGETLRSELADGWIWEPTTKEKLVAIWQRQGLPMD